MSFIDRIFIGEVIKDFGVVKEESFGIGRTRISALLTKKAGRLQFVIKESAWAILGISVRYIEFELVDAYKIRDYINQSESLTRNEGYSASFN